jgi:membrane protease YdiL (CAAX protease family)
VSEDDEVAVGMAETIAGGGQPVGLVRRWRSGLLMCELVGWFFLSPFLVLAEVWPVRYRLLLLAAAALFAAGTVWVAGATRRDLGLAPETDDGPKRRTAPDWAACAATGLAVWAVTVLAVAGWRWVDGEAAFPFLAEHPDRFARIAGIYFFSVAAQEFLFRAFFFWRYAPLMGAGPLFACNCVSFGWIHIIYGSMLSVLLSAAAGVLFGWLYLRHRSLVGVGIVHVAFGLAAFAMGFGRLFIVES